MTPFAYLDSRYGRQVSVVASLIFATALCASLLALRMAYTRGATYIDLLWNLFLAWLPMLSALAAFNFFRERLSLKTVAVLISAAIWLLFFPNAPYLLTDLMHLRTGGAPIWYDLILLIAFAWTGTFLGFVSLYMMQLVVLRVAGPLLSWIFALGTLGLGSFGIYLGRFLRFNSWDLLTDPGPILTDILDRLLHPLAHAQTFAFSFLFYLFLIAAYWMLLAMMQLRLDRRPD